MIGTVETPARVQTALFGNPVTQGIWRATPGRLVFRNGVLQDVYGAAAPWWFDNGGISGVFFTLDCIDDDFGHLTYNVDRWTFSSGHVICVARVATNVQVID